MNKSAAGRSLNSAVAAIYGPGTNIPDAAREVLGLVQKVRVAA